MKRSEIRKDYFLEQYVIIAPKRQQRPKKELKKEPVTSAECFFCRPQVDNPQNQIQVKNYFSKNGDWKVKVIENLYPAITLKNPKAYGSQEVIIETPDHSKEIHELSIEQIKRVFDVYIDRYRVLSQIKGVRYVVIFKNEGGKAGSSLPHSHSQVYALPLIPPKIAEESAAFNQYYQKNGTCPYCDIIRTEKNGPRVIWEDTHLFVLAPYASSSPYGAWFIPKRHICSIAELNEAEIESFAKALKSILAKLDEIDVAYNYYFQNSLDNELQHLVMKLAPRPNVWGGLEVDTGVIVNPIPPEDAAKFYQNKNDGKSDL